MRQTLEDLDVARGVAVGGNTKATDRGVELSSTVPARAASISLVRNTIRGSVTDPGPGFSTEPGAVTPRVDGGLGLFIVGRLAHEWGVQRVDGANQVWFEF